MQIEKRILLIMLVVCFGSPPLLQRFCDTTTRMIFPSSRPFAHATDSTVLEDEGNRPQVKQLSGLTLHGDLIRYVISPYQTENDPHTPNYIVKEINGTVLLNDFVRKLSTLLEKRRRVVEELAKATRTFPDQVDTIKTNEQLDAEEEKEKEPIPGMTYSLPFKKSVSFNRSSVRIPYSVLKTGLNSEDWSKNFDNKFRENALRDPSLKWQYFGSVEGFIRVFPSFEWTEAWPNGDPNIYDCRKEMWYTQAIACPHRTVILLDNSGSMKGLKKAIAISVVTALLDMLGDNDFFNIFAFSTNPVFIVPEFTDKMVRAIHRNKQMVIDRLEEVPTRNISRFANGIEGAMKLLNQFNTENNHSSCNCAVIIITDGLSQSFQHVFDDAFKNYSLQARVFTYLIGREKTDDASLKELACKNNGYYKQIESRNSVDKNIVQYTKVFNRPLSNSEDGRFVWTKAYYQTAFDNEPLGMVATVSTTVYGQTQYETGKKRRNLRGVVGTDITIDEMIQAMQIHKLDVNSYIYMITDDGLTMLHPRLHTKIVDKSSGMLITKPGYNSVDISFLELGYNTSYIRRRMIHRETGSLRVEGVKIPIQNWKRLLVMNGWIYYSAIPNTSFSIALFQPDTYGNQGIGFNSEFEAKQFSPEYTDENCKDVDSSNDSNERQKAVCALIEKKTEYKLADDWNYCRLNASFLLKEESRAIDNGTVENLLSNRFQSFNPENFECDDDLVNKALFDVYRTGKYMARWSEQSIRADLEGTFGLEMTFAMTSSGMSRKYWHGTDKDDFAGAECRKNKERIIEFQERSYPDLYRRAVELPAGPDPGKARTLYTFTQNKEDNLKYCDGKVTITAATPIRANKQNAILGVMGYIRNYTMFAERFWTQITHLTPRNDIIRNCKRENDSSPNSKYTKCYVLDENAYVIISDDDDEVQVPFSQINGEVMMALESASVFERHQVIDKNSFCEKEDDATAKAAILSANNQNHALFTFLSTTLCAFWHPKRFTWVLMNATVYLLWILFFTSQPIFTYARLKSSLEPCYVQHEVYTANYSKTFYNESRVYGDCPDCTREFSAIQLKNSNLYLLVVHNFVPNADIDNACPCIEAEKNNFVLADTKVDTSSVLGVCSLYGTCAETKNENSIESCSSPDWQDSEDNYYCSDDHSTKNGATPATRRMPIARLIFSFSIAWLLIHLTFARCQL